MDKLWTALLRQSTRSGATVKDVVNLDSPVTTVRNTDDGTAVDMTWKSPDGANTERFDYCISTISPRLLARTSNNFTQRFRSALANVKDTAACKVGWQSRSRFWEIEDAIYGGISWTEHLISQIWYPSDAFFSWTGMLTGAYNRGADAEVFGALSHKDRLRKALEGGERLHANFASNVFIDRGVSLAWHKMPHFTGGWADHTAETDPETYREINRLPEGRLFLAGDYISYMPGWMEGAVRSAYRATEAIARHIAQGG